MLWRRTKKTPEQLLERELLRQWRQERLRERLSMLPLELLQRSQCRALVETEEERLEAMGLLPVHRKLLRLIKRKIASASNKLVRAPWQWLTRQPCLQPARRALILFQRRLAIQCLAQMVRLLRLLLRLYRGTRKP